MSTDNLLLEIGTEEIPSGYFGHILDMLSSKDDSPVRMHLESHNIKVNKVSSFSTPRRIILLVEDIPFTQDVEIEGPPKRVAYDQDRNPTKALEAFLKKNNSAIEDISTRSSQKEDRIVLKRKDVSNVEVLKDVLPKIVKALDFPKSMRWEGEGFLFARPIRWILALLGDEVVDFTVGGVRSSNITHGHRFFGKKNIKIKNASAYFKALKKNHVFWDNEARKKMQLDFLKKKKWYENKELLDEVNNLIEYPYFLEGEFSKEFLNLPKDVLLASMSKHQRIFCLNDKHGELTSKFVAVLNGNFRGRKNIKKHYEEVLGARLKDAHFFYESDTKKPLSAWAEDLKAVVFHKELGTLSDKVERLKDISTFLAKSFSLDQAQKKSLVQAIRLCKADLLTQMVREFPSLQGAMGKYYALDSGEEQSVADAIGEHYLPRFADDLMPQSTLGTLCSLADKLDNIVCYFKIGKFPKGSWDLYALRRQAIAVISMLIKNRVRLSLSDIFDFVYAMAPAEADEKKIKNIFLDFFRERFIAFVKERYGYRYDLIESITTNNQLDDLGNCFLKLESLNSIIDESCFESARSVVERSYNIIRSEKLTAPEIKRSLLKEQEEKNLHDRLSSFEKEFKELCMSEEYQQATKLYADNLYDDLHLFFDKVMVNVDDKALKSNRMALLFKIHDLYASNIADLSKIIVHGS